MARKVVEVADVTCKDIAPNRPFRAPRTIGSGATKDAAETALHDKILELVNVDRTANNVACGSGKCEVGNSCFLMLELNQPPIFRRVRLGIQKRWLCIYEGDTKSSCICLETA